MELELTIWDAFSSNKLLTVLYSFIFAALLGIVLWLYKVAKWAVVVYPTLVFVAILAIAHEAVEEDLERINALKLEVMDVYEQSERFPLFPRNEYASLFGQLIMPEIRDDQAWLGFSRRGDVLDTPAYTSIRQITFLSANELETFSEHINSCYSENTVSAIWNHHLPGYPVSQSDAQAALQIAATTEEPSHPVCLTTASLLSAVIEKT